MSYSNEDLEMRLGEATATLLLVLTDPSDQKLFYLLHGIHLYLSEVEQSPPNSMEKTLSPLINALVDARLFGHWNVHVKVSVASCIIEVMRITAPDEPYDDDKMREVFKLIVSSLEHLDNISSSSYSKRINILATLSRVKACVLMLDLECDELLIEMFQHFLMSLRDHHPKEVFLGMENIMTLVLEESEDIPPQLLSPILHYVKNDDKIPKISRELAEQVLLKCAGKLKMYLPEAVKSLGVSLDEYSNVVATICEETFNCLKQDKVVGHDQNELASVKQSIVDTINSVREFRFEIETKEQSIVDTLTSLRNEMKRHEDILEASMEEINELEEEILGNNKIRNAYAIKL